MIHVCATKVDNSGYVSYLNAKRSYFLTTTNVRQVLQTNITNHKYKNALKCILKKKKTRMIC